MVSDATPRGVDIVLLAVVAWGRDIRCPLPPYSELDHRDGGGDGPGAETRFCSAAWLVVFRWRASGSRLRGLGLGFAVYFLLYVIRAMAPAT